jgi:hypothetical protein
LAASAVARAVCGLQVADVIAAAFCAGDDVVCHPRIVVARAFAAERAGGGVVADLSCCLEVAACACWFAFAIVCGLDDPVGDAVLVSHGRGRVGGL